MNKGVKKEKFSNLAIFSIIIGIITILSILVISLSRLFLLYNWEPQSPSLLALGGYTYADLIFQVAGFLDTIIFKNSFVILNIWSICHFLVGVIIMLLIIKFRLFKNKSFFLSKFMVLLYILLLYEAFELAKTLIFNSSSIFVFEKTIDTIFDIGLGMLGGLLGFLLYKFASKKITKS